MMTYVAMTRSLSTLALLAGVAGTILLVSLIIPRVRDRVGRALAGDERALLLAAWLTALVASVGSLYYSEVVGFPPCLLCWYQRIAMYPLVFVLGVGFLRNDFEAWIYGLPLSVVGLVLAGYHVLIQHRPALDVVTCDAAAPCTVRYVSAYGFVSIPVMAGFGFLLISALLVTVRVARKES